MSRTAELESPAAVVGGAAPTGTDATGTDAREESTSHAMRSPDRSPDLVVATDGTTDSDGAVRVGIALAQRDHANVQLVSFVEPLPHDAGGILATDTVALSHVLREARGSELTAQRNRTFPAAPEWPLTIEVGERVDGIVRFADRVRAGLTVLGLGEHGVSARLRGRETVARVIEVSKVPVLAVPRYAWGVPHSALAGLDFTPSSERAAGVALQLLGGQGTLFLAHVSARVVIPQGDSRGWVELTAGGSRAMLEAVARRLGAPPGVRIEFASLQGDPATELLAFADEFDIGTIAAGASDRSRVSKLVLGSVCSELVRNGRRWVLVSPPTGASPSRHS